MRTTLTVLLFAVCISLGGCSSPPHGSTADGVINTSLVRVLAHPEDYSGKRVGLVGYYHSEFEESGLYLTKDDATAHNYQSGLWVGGTAKDADTNKVHRVKEGFVRVVGTFGYTPEHGAGHMDLWFGLLDEITVFEARN
jgi:hypothetical protein